MISGRKCLSPCVLNRAKISIDIDKKQYFGKSLFMISIQKINNNIAVV